MLDHVNSNPFQKHYLGRQIDRDPYAIVRGLKPQDALVQKSCSIGHSISKRRPVDLTTEQAASVNFHPHILKLSQKVEELRRQAKNSRKAMELYNTAHRMLRNEKQTQRRALKQQVREEWTNKQAVADIESQLRGRGFLKGPTVASSSHPMRPAQKRLMDALMAPVEATVKGQLQRRDVAINVVIVYCAVAEGPVIRRTNCSKAEITQRSTIEEEPSVDGRRTAMLSVFVTSQEERPRRCFLCVGLAFRLELDDPHVEELTREFYSSGDVSKHFERKHLKNLREGDDIWCRACDMQLDHKMHLQNHALQIHGIVSRK